MTPWNLTDGSSSPDWNWTLTVEDDPRNGSASPDPVRPPFRLPWAFYPVVSTAQLASVLCLLITIFVYRRLPEFRNLPGRNLVSLCACLTLTYAFLFADFVFGARWIRPVGPACLALASLTHLAFLAVFAWTNVLAYDIWHTVSKTKGLTDTSCSSEDAKRRYYRYAVYAWTSTILVATVPLVQAWGSLDWSSVVPNPRLGKGRCWLNGQTAFLTYFNAPVGLALLANVVFFIMTAKTLVNIHSMTDMLNVRQHRQRFHLYLKLFLVMGFVWLTEFLPLVTGVHFLYAVAGFLTCLYGVALFVIFVCKARVWRSFRKTENFFCCWQRIKMGQNTSTRTTRIPSRTLTTSLSNIVSDVHVASSPGNVVAKSIRM